MVCIRNTFCCEVVQLVPHIFKTRSREIEQKQWKTKSIWVSRGETHGDQDSTQIFSSSYCTTWKLVSMWFQDDKISESSVWVQSNMGRNLLTNKHKLSQSAVNLNTRCNFFCVKFTKRQDEVSWLWPAQPVQLRSKFFTAELGARCASLRLDLLPSESP